MGDIVSPFVAPSAIRLQHEITDGEDSISERFTVWKDSATADLEVTVDSTEAVLRTIPDLARPDSVTFELTPNTPRVPGKFSFDIRIRSVAADGGHATQASIPVYGRVKADIAWTPEEVILAEVNTGQPVREDVVFWLRSGGELTVMEIIASPDFISGTVEGLEQASAQSGLLKLGLANTVKARSAGAILVRVRDASGREWKVSVPVTVQPLIVQRDL